MDNFLDFSETQKKLEGKVVSKVETWEENRGFTFYFSDGSKLPIRGGTLSYEGDDKEFGVVVFEPISFPERRALARRVSDVDQKRLVRSYGSNGFELLRGPLLRTKMCDHLRIRQVHQRS